MPFEDDVLAAMSDEDALEGISQFLIAHTAKDCSLMMSMQRVLEYPTRNRL